MENRWHDIWSNRDSKLESIDRNDPEQLILELKRIVGFDFFGKGGSLTFEAFRAEYEIIRDNLRLPKGGSVFEVGCGSGANLWFFKNDGYRVGGMDYAANLIEITEKVLGRENMIESLVGEASELPVEKKYDAVFSMGVFIYFNDLAYAERVLDRMLEKSKKSLGIFQLLDAEKEEEYHAHRRANVENYEEHYKGLPKLFYSREFFREYAAKHRLKAEFYRDELAGYWNAPFEFNCVMFRE